jgi:hypothetical protein
MRTREATGSSNGEEFYFVPTDEEEENGETERNNIKFRDKKEESKIEEDETTRKKKANEERTATFNTEERTKATTKKMKVTQDNFPFGHVCDKIVIDNMPYVSVYCQNVSGIFDRDGIGLDSAFKEVKQAGADIFTFNETH